MCRRRCVHLEKHWWWCWPDSNHEAKGSDKAGWCVCPGCLGECCWHTVAGSFFQCAASLVPLPPLGTEVICPCLNHRTGESRKKKNLVIRWLHMFTYEDYWISIHFYHPPSNQTFIDIHSCIDINSWSLTLSWALLETCWDRGSLRFVKCSGQSDRSLHRHSLSVMGVNQKRRCARLHASASEEHSGMSLSLLL